ncbi:MAG: PEGA domain-containing protein [Bdellovibrionales bacterium]|nr:PEGA domain-containing protein [Bdellovibrionales bacterium]
MIFEVLGIMTVILSFDRIHGFRHFFQKEDSVCMIVSEQENALIYINGKDSYKKTPSLIKIPKGQEIKMTLKKDGFQDHIALIKSNHELSFYHCRLVKNTLKLV